MVNSKKRCLSDQIRSEERSYFVLPTFLEMPVNISVERLLEQEVEEINRNGEEKYVKPFSLSEQLTHFAGKIDFYEGIDNVQVAEDEAEDFSNDNSEKNDDKVEEKWHWDGVHTKLRTALSETCVMLDVLQNLSKKKYLVLDPIQQNTAPEKQTIQMLEKRKYLARAGSIIGKGAMAMRKKYDESQVVEDNENDYYIQLMKLRQYWRMKKTGNQITGDVSYRSAGSKFWHPGLFEVKADHSEKSDSKTLAVNVSPDLATESNICVSVYDNNLSYKWNETSQFKARNFDQSKWVNQLKTAQHHLFNKELFANLSNDAFQGSFDGIEVLDYEITCQVLQDAKVVITHEVQECNKEYKKEEESFLDKSNIDLNFLLNQALLKQHKLSTKRHVPYPSTSNYPLKQSRSSTVYNLLNRESKPLIKESILHSFIEQAKLKIWITRVKHYFETKNLDVKNSKGPFLVTHWNYPNLKDHTVSVTVSIISTLNTRTIARSSLFLLMSGGKMTIIFEDANRIEMLCDIDSLDVIIKCRIKSHMITVVKNLCLLYGWSVISYTSPKAIIPHDGEPDCGVNLRNLKRRRSIFLQIFDSSNVKVNVQNNLMPDFVGEEFACVSNGSKTLDWNTIVGQSFVDKLQVLLLCS